VVTASVPTKPDKPPEPVKSTPTRLPGMGEIGSDLGRYKIVRALGEGATGMVYLAIDKQLNRQVALKVPNRSDDSNPSTGIPARMNQEAQAAAGLKHPGICQVFDVGCVGNIHFITTAYIEGSPLSKRIKGNKFLPVEEAVSLVRRIAAALAYAHDNDVIHRDLKTANIMITPKGDPVVMDFGLARRIDDDDASRLTQDGEVLGTMAYMPPEQLSGVLAKVGPHSDVYSLGCILYETLTGHVPFEGPPAILIMKMLKEDPRPLGELQPHLVGSPLDAVVQKALAKKVSERFQTMTEFDAALAAISDPNHKVGSITHPGMRRPDPNTVDRPRPSVTQERRVAAEPAVPPVPSRPAPRPTSPAAAHAPPTAAPSDPSPVPQAPPTSSSPPESSDAKVGCKVYAPPKVHRSTTVLIQVFAFPSEMSREVAERATLYDDAAVERGAVFLPFDPRRNQNLCFHLVMPGGEVSDPVRQMHWCGNMDSVQFAVKVPARHPIGPMVGTVLVSSGDVPMGRIDFQLTVVRWFRRAKREAQPVAVSAARFRKAFVSYSSKDRPEVIRRVQMLRPPITDIVVFQDVLTLEPGDGYESLLLQRIDECDIFLLFWSSNARNSEWVLREIRHAMKRQGAGGESPPTILPVIIEGPPPPPPPTELAHLHFNDYLLYFAN
jgi:serine/threonine protein kinase